MLDRSFFQAQPSRASSAALAGLVCGFVLGLASCGTSAPVDPTSSAGKAGTGPSHGGGGEGGTGGQGGSATTSQGAAAGSAAGGSAGQAGSGASECPPGWFASGLDSEGQLACAPLSPAARDAVNGSCAMYLGWRDACTGCDLDPAKWGYASADGCKNGVGVDDTCTSPTLDGTEVQLFGLNLDGNVNTDDKIHLGFHCSAADAAVTPGPCGPGSFATSLKDGQATCVSASAPVLDHVRTRCSLYFGWRDTCDGCTSAPDRWGAVGPTGCTLGLGNTNTCTMPSLGGEEVQLFGLSMGGDVDGNDKLYMALHCNEPLEGTTMTKGTCPGGQLITGIAADGTLRCESPAKVVAEYFDAHCTAYFGWRDGCNGCAEAPAKWGRIRNGFCTNDNGVDNTCTQTVLGGEQLEMFGLSPDGDVNGDDVLYVGFRCD
jgi:hypothetical protein